MNKFKDGRKEEINKKTWTKLWHYVQKPVVHSTFYEGVVCVMSNGFKL